jgi:hypothetical protein
MWASPALTKHTHNGSSAGSLLFDIIQVMSHKKPKTSLKLNQTGFGHIVAIALIITIGMIGIVGWRIWDGNKQEAVPANLSNNPTPLPRSSDNKDPINPAAYEYINSIINKEKAPESLQKYLFERVREDVKACLKDNQKMYEPPTRTVRDVVKGKYAVVDFAACNELPGASYTLLVLNDNKWLEIGAVHAQPDCISLEKYDVPASIELGDSPLTTCNDENNQPVNYPRDSD